MNRTAARSVTVIPPTINPLTHLSRVAVQKRRVAGYARVSTDSDEQFTSYEAQVDYYTQYIKRNPEWEFVKVYTDEGISGTNTKHRIGFNEMIADAMSGKIDLIVTKSVSRFARNTVDSLVTIRKLKEKGVEAHHHVELGTGRKPLHIRECYLGTKKTVCRWKGQPPIQAVPRLSQRSGRFSRSRSGGGNRCPPDLYSIHGGVDAGGHCKGTDSRWDSDSIEKTTLADQYSGKHPSKREIQGRCTPSEMLHGRFPHEKEEGQ